MFVLWTAAFGGFVLSDLINKVVVFELFLYLMEFVRDAGIDHAIADLKDKAADEFLSYGRIQLNVLQVMTILYPGQNLLFYTFSNRYRRCKLHDLDALIGFVLGDKGRCDFGQMAFPLLCQQ